MAVAKDLGRCLRTKLEVRPVQVAKKPESMACVHVLTTGLKAARCRYWTRSAFVVILCALDVWKLSGRGTGPAGRCRSIKWRPFHKSRVPVKMVSALVICTLVSSKMALNPCSHS